MATIFGLSDPGSRKINEDACYFDINEGLAIVCDGISASGGGDVASAVAIETIKNKIHANQKNIADYKQNPSAEKRHKLTSFMDEIIAEASRTIFQQAQKNPKQSGMCTTVDVLLDIGTHMILGHVGSGRCYLWREKNLHLISEDHTQLAEFRKKGKTFPPGVEESALAKRITRAVGYGEQVKVDVLEIELMADDRFLLCTDGVWASLTNEELTKLLTNAVPEKAVQKMMDYLKVLQPKDNYTALITEPSAAPFTDEHTKETSAEAKIQLAGKIPVFAYLSYPELIKLMSISELFKVSSNTIVCKEGEPGDEMMIILSGLLEVQIQGKKIAELGAGQAVGEMSMIEGGARSATLVAKVNTNLIAFSRVKLYSLLREEPELCVKFLWGLTGEINRRLRATSNQLAGKKIAGVQNEAPKQGKELLPFIYRRELT